MSEVCPILFRNFFSTWLSFDDVIDGDVVTGKVALTGRGDGQAKPEVASISITIIIHRM